MGRFDADPHRPRYHFMPPAHWMNDPNGLILWKGQYHLFYQHNPNGAFWGTMHWGHAASRDLIHWTHLPIALAPTPGGPDKDGCFSGSAVDNGGIPTLLYTGVSPEVQCVATSKDGMMSWQKYGGNPVIRSRPEGTDETCWRDPHVWREEDTWFMLIGSGTQGGGGAALLYESADLIHWKYLHPFCAGQRTNVRDKWECPDFFPLGGRHALLVSGLGTTLYLTGRYAAGEFHPEVEGRADFGGHFYAGKTLLDRSGRRLLWGWMPEGRGDAAQRAAGWAGALSLPRVLSLDEDGTLRMEPLPELKVLRGKHWHCADLDMPPDGAPLLGDAAGDCLEIEAEFETGSAERLGIELRRAPDDSEKTTLVYDCSGKRLSIDREKSSLTQDVKRGVQGGPCAVAPGEPLKLHIFLDRSVVEVFANERMCLTSRTYPSRADSLGIGVFAQGGRARLRLMDVWEIAPLTFSQAA